MSLSEVGILAGFNPCKGFGGFGTFRGVHSLECFCGFNPCKGFGGFGTQAGDPCSKAIASFNPCKGFGGFGTCNRFSIY